MINGEEKANAPRFADSTKPTAADWIAEIKRIWARGPASTLELARLICMIRHQLPRGEWTALWRSGEMPFGRRKGYMLLRIANGLGWANVQTFAHLPTGWSILHQLARLDRQTLEQLIQQGFVHPKLTLREAKELVARLIGKRTEARMRKASFRLWLRRSVEFVRNNKSDWNPDERELVTEELTRLIEEINAVETAIFKGSPSTFITQLGLLTDPGIKL